MNTDFGALLDVAETMFAFALIVCAVLACTRAFASSICVTLVCTRPFASTVCVAAI
jgi:hypothetical protein